MIGFVLHDSVHSGEVIGQLFDWLCRGTALDGAKVSLPVLLEIDCKTIDNSQTSVCWPYLFGTHLSFWESPVSVALPTLKVLVLL